MAGVNGQEGGVMYSMEIPMVAKMLNKTSDVTVSGVDMEIVDTFLNMKCSTLTPLSSELCVNFLKDLYKLEQPTCDNERARRLCDLQGMCSFSCSRYEVI